MARPAGVRNQDFEEKRLALIGKMTSYVLKPDIENPSFRQLAIAAEVSEPTLRHYFTDRSGVIVAIIEHLHTLSESMRESTREAAADIPEALERYHEVVGGFRRNTLFIRAQAFMIRESMSDPQARKAYIDQIIGPSIDAVAERLVKTPGGPSSYETGCSAGMMLMSASIFMILHQELLDGKTHMPIDEQAYFRQIRFWMQNGLKNDPDGSDGQSEDKSEDPSKSK